MLIRRRFTGISTARKASCRSCWTGSTEWPTPGWKPPPTDWDTCLIEFATTTLDTFLQYPAIAVTATSLTTSGPGELDSMELMLACFSEAGLQGRSLAEQYAIFGSYVLAGAAGLARDLADPADNGILRVVCRPDARRAFAPPIGHSRAATTSWPLSNGKYSFAGVEQIIAAAKEKAQNQGPDSHPDSVALTSDTKTPWAPWRGRWARCRSSPAAKHARKAALSKSPADKGCISCDPGKNASRPEKNLGPGSIF